MSKIKTFPLHFTEEQLILITDTAIKKGFRSTKDFIHSCINKELNKPLTNIEEVK